MLINNKDTTSESIIKFFIGVQLFDIPKEANMLPPTRFTRIFSFHRTILAIPLIILECISIYMVYPKVKCLVQ